MNRNCESLYVRWLQVTFFTTALITGQNEVAVILHGSDLSTGPLYQVKATNECSFAYLRSGA